MEKEAWREQFRATAEGEIHLVSTRFRTFGAGVPDSAPTTYIEDGWVVMRGIERTVNPLVLRAHAETEHQLTLDPESREPVARRLEAGRYILIVENEQERYTP